MFVVDKIISACSAFVQLHQKGALTSTASEHGVREFVFGCKEMAIQLLHGEVWTIRCSSVWIYSY